MHNLHQPGTGDACASCHVLTACVEGKGAQALSIMAGDAPIFCWWPVVRPCKNGKAQGTVLLFLTMLIRRLRAGRWEC